MKIFHTVEFYEQSRGGSQEKDDHGYSHAIIDKSAQILTDLVKDKAMQSGLAKSVHKAWLDKFSWQKISEQYLDLYKEVLTR